MELSERIFNLMEKRKLSRYKLAKLAKVPYTTLIKILDGTTKNPQIETLSEIADYFGVSVDYLLEKSAGALIEERLKQAGMTIEELAEQTKVPIRYLRNLDGVDPIEPDYKIATQIAKVLGVEPKELLTALARQEPPVYDGPRDTRSLEEIFADEDFEEPLSEEPTGADLIEAVSKEPTEEQILTLAARCVGHKGSLSGRELEQVKMALRIALAKEI